jgi:hypothetical protein
MPDVTDLWSQRAQPEREPRQLAETRNSLGIAPGGEVKQISADFSEGQELPSLLHVRINVPDSELK